MTRDEAFMTAYLLISRHKGRYNDQARFQNAIAEAILEAVAEEREACAKEADTRSILVGPVIAAAIRKRGQN